MNVLNISTRSKQYPLFIGKGLRYRVGELLKEMNRSYSKYLIITDETVAPLYLQDVIDSLGEVVTHIVPNGEKAKSFDHYYSCLTTALENGLDRKSCIIALGGGVVGDLAGFAAASYMRGIGFIQVPTTLLAHDSSVGGKVAINHPLGKNMIGSFYQPDAVIYDVETFQSLPDVEWRSGFSEVIKHALIWDSSFYEELKREIPTINELKNIDLTSILEKAIGVKAEVVSQDEKETGIRAYLNFGHTLAHAIEAELGYGKVSHGEAVAIGMIFAMRVSEKHYEIKLPIESIEEWFKQLSLPIRIPSGLSADKLIERMKMDKKAMHGEIYMVLQKKIGEVETTSIDEKVLYLLLEKEIERGL
ncbi:3-dehydroquinate synthase [Bacillus taeanensis]|uniref:3-dehydroquinate synthase n=1 Tax=Bacillus taeanensis TaxID=273032 RepID=A0A366Y249_9BACI|nr:3-dehydroquinate synthase [Bacillus taeanensis]RBW70281.1 3-dehydroquinate synthase [Bacillus taeanensis]